MGQNIDMVSILYRFQKRNNEPALVSSHASFIK